MNNKKEKELLKEVSSVRAIIFSIDLGKVYVALFSTKNSTNAEVWGLPTFSLDEVSSKGFDFVVQKINEVTNLNISSKNIRKEISEEVIKGENKEKILYFIIETPHTIISLVNKDTFNEVKWLLLNELEKQEIEGISFERLSTYTKFLSLNTLKHKKALFTVITLLTFLVILCGFFYKTVLLPRYKAQEVQNKITQHTNAYYSSLLKNDPTEIQGLFVDDIKNGINDKYTKADAYFVTHRFFDNGGNIYEIYNYIESHPELAFLKEAEAIYPDWFKQIKDKTLPPTYVDRSLYTYLAYVEVLQKHGYTDVAALGTAANQYAKTAYFNTTIAKEMTKEEGAARSRFAKRDLKKALDFFILATPEVNKFFNGTLTDKDITPRDLLVGLNQYAATMRYAEALGLKTSSPEVVALFKAKGIDISSVKSPSEIFSFTVGYSYKNVPELTLFTALLNASTLAILASSTPEEIKIAMYPILDLDVQRITLETSIIHKILDSRFEKKPTNIGETNMDIYSKRNTLNLARKVPEFTTWLMSNGWKSEDFK